MNVRQAVITLGGKGSRLKSITGNIPKPLWEINGTSTLERALRNISDQGIKNFVFLCGYRSDLFTLEARKLGNKYNVKIAVHTEPEPRGEVGALRQLKEKLDDIFVFINGDLIFMLDLKRMADRFFAYKADIMIATHTTNHPEDSDCIREGSSGEIAFYKPKSLYIRHKGFYLGNAGIGICKRDIVCDILNHQREGELSFFNDVVVVASDKGKRVFSYNTSEYIKDMGTVERLRDVSIDIEGGVLERRCYTSTQSALFIDRDNTLNVCKEGGYINSANEIQLLMENIERLKALRGKYDQCYIITNQPQVAMGLVNYDDMVQLTGIVIEKCVEQGLLIDGFYACIHHEDKGFKGEIKELKQRCFCRKPNPGLIYQAAFEKNIELKRSIFVGDSWRDEIAAKNANIEYIDVGSITI